MTQQEFTDLVGEAIFVEIEAVETISEKEEKGSRSFLIVMASGEKFCVSITNQL